jgi:hypothetical protein
MKKIIYLFLLAASTMLLAASCGKDGAVGPQGAAGQQGAVGPAGPAGANGQPGSVIYSGTTMPPATTGAIGDFYLNTSTGLLYGPKTTTGWGMGFSLVGPGGAPGAAGLPGNTVLSGMGMPAAALGNVGDFYLDKVQYMLYGPKTATGWGPAVSLRGPAGTANVIYSGWNALTNLRDSTTYYGAKVLFGDMPAPALTQSVLDNGAFMVYHQDFGDNPLTQDPLPYVFFSYGNQITYTISFIAHLGVFTLSYSQSDDGLVSGYAFLTEGVQYRYVIIPGGQSIGLNQHVNLKDYEAVRKFYRIPD